MVQLLIVFVMDRLQTEVVIILNKMHCFPLWIEEYIHLFTQYFGR